MILYWSFDRPNSCGNTIFTPHVKARASDKLLGNARQVHVSTRLLKCEQPKQLYISFSNETKYHFFSLLNTLISSVNLPALFRSLVHGEFRSILCCSRLTSGQAAAHSGADNCTNLATRAPPGTHCQNSKHIDSSTMFAKLTTKIALRKAGIPSSFSVPTFSTTTDSPTNPQTHKKASSEDNILLPFTNPFKDVTIPAVWNTWATPPPPPVEVRSERPSVGSNALQLGSETRGKLGLGDGRECLVVFLRWCGCPCKYTFVILLLPVFPSCGT